MLLLGRLRSGISSRTSLGLLSTRIQRLPRLSKRSTSELSSSTSASELITPPPSLPSSSSSPSSPSPLSTPSPSSTTPLSTSRPPLPTEFAFPLVFQHPNHAQPFPMLHDVKMARKVRLALTDGVDYATSVARRSAASRLSSPDRRIFDRARLASGIAKVVRAQDLELSIFGAVSTKTHVDKSYLSLGVVVAENESRPSKDVLTALVEPLRAFGLEVKVSSDILRCEYTPTATYPHTAVAFVSIQSKSGLLLNSLIASYTALSPDVLVPLIRAVSAIGPGKEFIVNDNQRSQMISFLCIAYLQSLSTPLLPNLQSKDLISKLNPPSSQCSLPVRRNHIGKETVDTTFVYIGVIPPLKEKLGWEQGTEADREFAREWVGKGKDSPPLTDLVRGFYFVYGGKARSMFDWDTGVVAVRYGGLRIRERVDGCLSWSKGSLVIQHPFVDTINLSAQVKEGPDQIDSMFARCLEDELLRDGAPPLDYFMYGPTSSPPPPHPTSNPSPPPQSRRVPSPSPPSPSSSTNPATLPPFANSSNGLDPTGYQVIFENLPSAFDRPTFNRFLQSTKLEFDGPAALASCADGSLIGGIVVKDLEVAKAATKTLDKIVVYGQPISVKLSPPT